MLALDCVAKVDLAFLILLLPPSNLGLQALCYHTSPFLVENLKTMFSYFLRNGGGVARQFLCGIQTPEVCALISGSQGWKIPDDLLMWLVISLRVGCQLQFSASVSSSGPYGQHNSQSTQADGCSESCFYSLTTVFSLLLQPHG